jgi:hypothetical protein
MRGHIWDYLGGGERRASDPRSRERERRVGVALCLKIFSPSAEVAGIGDSARPVMWVGVGLLGAGLMLAPGYQLLFGAPGRRAEIPYRGT